jgi:DNA helicase HerA-like ATPase
MAINPNEDLENNHALAIGKSGSGKTWFIKNHPLVKKRGSRVVFWDPYESHDCHYSKSLTEFGRNFAGAIKSGKGFKIGLAVNPSIESFENFCRMVWVAADGNKKLIVVVEELADVSKPSKATEFWGQLTRVGRKYGLIVIPATQRPQEIDKTVFTQVSRVWVGLVSPYDHGYVEKSTGIEKGGLAKIKPETYHYFYVHGSDIQYGTPQKKVKL